MTRNATIARVRARLTASGYPRVVMLFIVALSGGVAFLFSAGALRLGLAQMGVRYFLATLVGYGTFLLLVRVWIAYRRRSDFDYAAPDITDGLSGPDVSHAHDHAENGLFAGGRSGGGGGGATWGKSTAGGSSEFNVDADELWPVVLVVACAVGAVIALVYVVYAAPLLLAEVALDAALVGGLYRRLRRQDARHWLGSALRRTWLPALATSLMLTVIGFALQWAAPDAQSIGSAVRTLLSRT